MYIESKFEHSEKERYKNTIRGTKHLNYDKCGGFYLKKEDDGSVIEVKPSFILKDGRNNLYPTIRESTVKYFDSEHNDVKWWSLKACNEDGTKPPTHVLSSQVCCLNHLFPLRNDPDAVLAIAQAVDPGFTKVCMLDNDKDGTQGYISFEVVGKENHLNESCNKRGEFCTSVDALILGIRNGKRTMIVIEWKYTESYLNEDLSKEDRPENPGGMDKGNTRLRWYSDLIRKYLKADEKDLRGSLFFFEPFYQLMRQTIWAEEMIVHRDTEFFQAEDYIHVHVIPSDNRDLLDNSNPMPGMTMEETWRSVLKDQSKYKIVDPKELLSLVKDKDLVDYLDNRYWKR